MQSITVTYAARSQADALVEGSYPAEECLGCRQVFLWRAWADGCEHLANRAPAGFRLIPEHGFLCTKEIEVFAFVQRLGAEPRVPVVRTLGGLQLRYGPQSRLFRDAANHITRLDLGDYGLDVAPTVRIRPPPPYSGTQVANLQILQARLELALDQLGGMEDEVGHRLLATVSTWRHDRDRRALALASAIRNREHPGRVVNSFRLLELVLESLLDAEIARSRRDSTVDDRAFRTLAETYKVDLKTRLMRRVESLPRRPDQLLESIGRALRPSKPFTGKDVFGALATFRNQHVHQPRGDSESLLPWEAPDFEEIASLVLQLIVDMLEHDLGGIGG